MVKAVEPDQIHALLNNVQTFSQALSDSSHNFTTLVRDGAVLAGHLNNSSKSSGHGAERRGLGQGDQSKKIAGIVNAANEVVETVHQNRGSINVTPRTFERSAKLNIWRTRSMAC